METCDHPRQEYCGRKLPCLTGGCPDSWNVEPGGSMAQYFKLDDLGVVLHLVFRPSATGTKWALVDAAVKPE